MAGLIIADFNGDGRADIATADLGVVVSTPAFSVHQQHEQKQQLVSRRRCKK
jgi:hypothetical protein